MENISKLIQLSLFQDVKDVKFFYNLGEGSQEEERLQCWYHGASYFSHIDKFKNRKNICFKSTLVLKFVSTSEIIIPTLTLTLYKYDKFIDK